MIFEKVDFMGTIAPLNLRGKWTKVHRTFFAQRRRKCCQSNSFPILDTSVRSGDIHTQSGKGSKIGPNLAFSPPIFFWGGGQASKFLDGHL